VALKVYCASCPYVVVMPEALKKDEAPNIGVKPVASMSVALNAKDLAAATKIATPKAVMNSIPMIVCGVAKKAEKESGYREQGNSFLKEPTEIHCIMAHLRLLGHATSRQNKNPHHW